MRRIVSLLIAVSLVVTLFAGVSLSAAEYNDQYVWNYTTPGLPVTASGGIGHDPNAGDGYAVISSSADAADPWFFININVPSTQKYVAVKYAANSVAPGKMIVTAPPSVDWGMEGAEADPQWITDGEWHLAVYEIASTFTGVGDLTITTIRFPGAAAGDSLKIAYVGFFTTAEEAGAYDDDYSAQHSGVDAEPSDETEEPADPTEPAEPAEPEEVKNFQTSIDFIYVDDEQTATGGGHGGTALFTKKDAYTVAESIGIAGWAAVENGIAGYQYSVNDGPFEDATYTISDRTGLAEHNIPYPSGHSTAGFTVTIPVPAVMSENSKITVRAITKDGGYFDFFVFADVSHEYEASETLRSSVDFIYVDGEENATGGGHGGASLFTKEDAFVITEDLGIAGWLAVENGIAGYQYSVNDGPFVNAEWTIQDRSELGGFEVPYPSGHSTAGFKVTVPASAITELHSKVTIRAITLDGKSVEFFVFADVSVEGMEEGPSDATETPTNPTTGDNSAVTLFAVVALLAATAISVTVILKKRSCED